MTDHPLDTEALRREALGQLGRIAADPRWPGRVLSLLDLLAAAEHRATRAEAQSAIRGRAVVIYRDRAREAEAERDCRRRENAELRDELVATQEYGAKLAHGKDEAEARIKTVLDMCDDAEDPDQRPPRPVMHGGEPFPESLMVHDIRHALDGEA